MSGNTRQLVEAAIKGESIDFSMLSQLGSVFVLANLDYGPQLELENPELPLCTGAIGVTGKLVRRPPPPDEQAIAIGIAMAQATPAIRTPQTITLVSFETGFLSRTSLEAVGFWQVELKLIFGFSPIFELKLNTRPELISSTWLIGMLRPPQLTASEVMSEMGPAILRPSMVLTNSSQFFSSSVDSPGPDLKNTFPFTLPPTCSILKRLPCNWGDWLGLEMVIVLAVMTARPSAIKRFPTLLTEACPETAPLLNDTAASAAIG